MAPEKATDMVLKVDLKCPCCYKKIKKVLGQFPLSNQVFDEKHDTVYITVVVCCNPEEIRNKIAKKGGKTIKSIEIKEAPKPKPATDKPKEESNKPKGDDKPKPDKPKEVAVPVHVPVPAPVLVQAPAVMPPAAMMVQAPMGYPYYMPDYGGYHSGPVEPSYNQGYWKPVPVSDNYGYYGYDHGAYRGSGYNNEENQSGCTIM
ncbi:protein PYRICULARIA ORYZAE RESISTANCE 21-like isoform X2 [Impatiens glandulifera]|uniref:protein PYRICULARIA ORYZAE RESISTANCE 21-like isoform X2 n=1 Tax=Impatiens glandulifera TaxID=253017 RepID=UPI001FB184E3|nr:protein PYRICULARIA ORYZAE RESISTANCE 21-like isoform X2 [Impatiens glandulifera]